MKPPPLRNDCFALPPGVEWTPAEQALARLRSALHPVTGIERLPTRDAGGRYLAEQPRARRAHPPAANSAVDGYGFAHAAIADRPADEVITLPLVAGRAAAGAPYPGKVPPGHAIRILTGAVLPEGVDTVVLEEDCAIAPDRIAFRAPVKPRANTRAAGEDVPAGAPLLATGRRLTPADLALLSATGVAEVAVRRPLRVGIVSTGDELAEPGAASDPAATPDANRPMLCELVRRWGHEAHDLGILRDDRPTIATALEDAAHRLDAILTSGGASAGDEDHVSAVLRERANLVTWRIAIKPGRPLALALWHGTPVFGLPGNPVAAFVCALVFARPALARLAGGAWPEPLAFTVPAAFTKTKKPGRREYLRARLDASGAAEPFASEGSGRISGLSWAEGLIELPEEACTIAPGDPVRYLPFAGFGLAD